MPNGLTDVYKQLREMREDIADLRVDIGSLKGTAKGAIIVLGVAVPVVTFLIGKWI